MGLRYSLGRYRKHTEEEKHTETEKKTQSQLTQSPTPGFFKKVMSVYREESNEQIKSFYFVRAPEQLFVSFVLSCFIIIFYS